MLKKVPIPDVSCIFCHDHEEHAIHLFEKCTALDCFWKACSISGLPRQHPAGDLTDWIMDVAFTHNSQQLDMLLTCLWTIWKERDNILWNQGTFNPLFMATWATNHLAEYKKLHPLKLVNKKRVLTHWKSPPSGRLKVNVDGHFRINEALGGSGVVVRDEHGHCVAALARQLPYATSALYVHMEACRAGLITAINHGWSDIEMETNCIQLVTTMKNPCEDRSEFGRIIEDCRIFSNTFNSFVIHHISREANGVAYRATDALC